MDWREKKERKKDILTSSKTKTGTCFGFVRKERVKTLNGLERKKKKERYINIF
jgi:hypothetical protein